MARMLVCRQTPGPLPYSVNSPPLPTHKLHVTDQLSCTCQQPLVCAYGHANMCCDAPEALHPSGALKHTAHASISHHKIPRSSPAPERLPAAACVRL
jgi:hypothetical protein